MVLNVLYSLATTSASEVNVHIMSLSLPTSFILVASKTLNTFKSLFHAHYKQNEKT